MFTYARGTAALFARILCVAVVFGLAAYGTSAAFDDGDRIAAAIVDRTIAADLSAIGDVDPSSANDVTAALAGTPSDFPGNDASAAALNEDGAEIYMTRCMSCHQLNGRGVPGVFPPLAGAEWVTGDKGRLIRIVLGGLMGEINVEGEAYSGAMPPWGGFLDDKQTSDLLTYIRKSWGNQADAITPDEVGRVRAATKERREPWTQAELLTDAHTGIPGEPAPAADTTSSPR